MISAQQLSYAYKNNAPLLFPDLNCTAGEALLITGGSGTGKTTLLHLLAGLIRPKTGNIIIDGIDLNSLSEKKLDSFRGQNIGLVLQESHFVESLSVAENIQLASWLASGKKSSSLHGFLEQLGIGDQSHKLPSQLSIGQQQRVSIARALINKPRLLLADEPTSSLDDANAFAVADLLSELSKQSKTALIIVTHDQRLKDRFKNAISL
ncbi:MAG: ATP-binding cassette domain-containing protein [Flavobacterium sp.]|nr:ATP-binding cassette domain-containing protein [Flavobacterium sp.]